MVPTKTFPEADMTSVMICAVKTFPFNIFIDMTRSISTNVMFQQLLAVKKRQNTT